MLRWWQNKTWAPRSVLKNCSQVFPCAEFWRHVNDHSLIKWVENYCMLNSLVGECHFYSLYCWVWIFPCFCSFEHTYFIGLEDWVHTASVSSVWPALIDQTTEETSRLLLKALCPWESAGCRRPASSNLDAWRPSENHLVLCPCSQMGSLLAQTTHHSLRGGSAPVVEHQGQGEGKTCVFREYPAWFVGSCCTRRVRPRVTYLGF